MTWLKIAITPTGNSKLSISGSFLPSRTGAKDMVKGYTLKAKDFQNVLKDRSRPRTNITVSNNDNVV